MLGLQSIHAGQNQDLWRLPREKGNFTRNEQDCFRQPMNVLLIWITATRPLEITKN
jgi:hypothetical protein